MIEILHLADLLFLIPDKEHPKSPWKPSYVFANPNFFISNFTKYPSLLTPNNINSFSGNLHITFEFACANLSNINLEVLSSIYNISIPTILSHPEIEWYYPTLGFRTDFDFEANKDYFEINCIDGFYKLDSSKKYWNWHLLTVYTNIRTIERTPNLPWDKQSLSWNRTITLQYIKFHPDIPWDFATLSHYINIKEIKKDLSLPWNFHALSSNPTLTSGFLIEYINQDWDWDLLSTNEYLYFDKLINISTNWNWIELSKNHGLTKNFVRFYFDQFNTPNLLRNIYRNKIIPIKDILSDPLWPKEIFLLSYHPEITADHILSHNLDKSIVENLCVNQGLKVTDLQKLIDENIELDFTLLSTNPNLSFNFIHKHKDKKWNYVVLSQNHFNYERQEEIVYRIKINYLRRKREKAKMIIREYVIPDLVRIIRRYL